MVGEVCVPIIRGANVHPSPVEHGLMRMPELEPDHLLVVRGDDALNSLGVQVKPGPERARQGPGTQAAIAARVRREIRERVGLTAAVRLVPAKSLDGAWASPGVCRTLAGWPL